MAKRGRNMDSRALVKGIAARENASGKCAFWTGHPHPDTEKLYIKATNTQDLEGVYRALGDDCRWISACASYLHPEGKPMFDTTLGQDRHTLSGGGAFADCEDTKEIEAFPWPDVKYLDFSPSLTRKPGNRSGCRLSWPTDSTGRN